MTSLADGLATGATVLAAGLALLSIEQNRRQARKAERSRLLEHRADFYLERLLQISSALEKGSNVAFADATLKLELRMLPANVLPLTRVAFSEGINAAAMERYLLAMADAPDGAQPRQYLLPQMRAEIVEAAATYLSDPASVSQPTPRRSWRTLWLTRRRQIARHRASASKQVT